MIIRYFIFIFLGYFGMCTSFAQHKTAVVAVVNDSTHTINIQQEIVFENTSTQGLSEILLNDWANSLSDKQTPLAHRFAEDYLRRFHFASEEERGATKIYSITNEAVQPFDWERPKGSPDIIQVNLPSPLLPGEKVKINLLYQVKVPSDKFTGYGYDNQGNYKLKYWYVTPAVFDEEWQAYSDKNLKDQYTAPIDIDLTISVRPYLYVATPLVQERIETAANKFKTLQFSGQNQVSSQLYLTKSFRFEEYLVNSKELLSNLEDEGMDVQMKGYIISKILKYLEERLGPYPHPSLMVTQEDYIAANPIYGLNQLPKFIRPFPDGFQYDLKQFKTITHNYLKSTLLLNPREEQWVYDAILIKLMMDYVDKYYPNMKLMGSLSDVIGIRWFKAADLEFNDQYRFWYLHMARMNLDQPLSTAQDSLIKFNTNIANSYKAGTGLKYVEDFLDSDAVEESIKEFYQTNVLKPASEEDFREILEKNAEKDISWFFNDYIERKVKIDFTIDQVRKMPNDSLLVTIRNKGRHAMPVSLYGLNNGNVVFKTWVESINKTKQVTIPGDSIERLALNYEGVIPERNQRDNFEGVTTLLDKPLQARLLMDVEDPEYHQVFVMPEASYNLYDGIAIGPKLYNKTVLTRDFEFSLAPKYGFNSQTLVGSASFSNVHYIDEDNLFSIRYGISGNRFSYGFGQFYEKFTPYIRFLFRDDYLRDNKRQSLLIRNVNVKRDIDPLNPIDQPKYNVFNVAYNYREIDLVNLYAGGLDFQIAENFSKLSLDLEYRKLFKNNQQINLRLFAGTFLYNDEDDNDYFSFALDRPTDYLFDYNYYGRSQSEGLFSQQIIMAEGGFKSQLQPEFANQWITTFNASTNIWKWIFAYGDLGLVKNKYTNAEFLYDSGIRMSLIQDYFEVFFPVYSNLGWEIAQDNYDQKIRFIVTLDLRTLLKLFSREWY